MMRYLWAAVLILSVALGGAVYAARGTREALTLTKVQVDGLSARLATVEARNARMQADVQSLVTRSQRHETNLRAAIQSNPTWAADPVPPAVSGRLCEYLTCAD